MNKEKMYILTDGFPYGRGEKTFILPEIEKLRNQYDITLIASAPQRLTLEKDLTTKLDDDIKVIRFCQTEENKIIFYFFLLLFWSRRICWAEVKEILKKRKKIILRIWKSMYFFAKAEIFYRWIRKKNIVGPEKGIYYSYWYNDKVLAMTMHRNKYPALKIITRAHGYDLFDERVSKTLRQPFKKIMDAGLDKVIFASAYGFQYYLDKMGTVSELKYVVHKIGAPIALPIMAHEREKNFRIVSCSNIIPLKRVSLIVDSLSKMQDIFIEWIHFGDGFEKKYIEEYAQERLAPKENISYKLIGYVSRDEIYEFYSNTYVNCFLTLSSSEGGCPVSIQEALAYGIPIIGTAVGGITEMIDGNGYLLNADLTPAEVADKIRKMAKLDQTAYGNMRAASLQIWKKEYNQAENAEKFRTWLLTV